MSCGPVPTLKVPRIVPSLDRSLVTLLDKKFVVQMFLPSKVTNTGSEPTSYIASMVPSLAPSFVTVLADWLAIQKARSVENDACGSCSGGECAHNHAIAGAEFGHSAVELVGTPSICTILVSR